MLEWALAQGYAVAGGPATTARELQALVDGLTVHVLLDRVSDDEARATVGAAVARLVTDASADPVR